MAESPWVVRAGQRSFDSRDLDLRKSTFAASGSIAAFSLVHFNVGLSELASITRTNFQSRCRRGGLGDVVHVELLTRENLTVPVRLAFHALSPCLAHHVRRLRSPRSRQNRLDHNLLADGLLKWLNQRDLVIRW